MYSVGDELRDGREKLDGEVAAGVERWLAQPPSRLLDHGRDCCELARRWFHSLDYSFDSMLASADRFRGPGWVRDRYPWGPSRWPLYWCEAVEARRLDCGALTALACEVFASRGVTCWPVQLIQRFSVRDIRQWREQWGSGPGLFGWTAGEFIYHEAAAVVAADGSIGIWDPTHNWWIPSAQSDGYGSTLFVRVSVTDHDVARDVVIWGSHRLRPSEWEELGGGRAREARRPSLADRVRDKWRRPIRVTDLRDVAPGSTAMLDAAAARRVLKGPAPARPVLPRKASAPGPAGLAQRIASTWRQVAQQHAAAGFVDALLRGAGQVTFQDNPVTGLLLLAGLLYGSWRLGIAALVGLTTSTLAGIWLGADRAKVRAGVFGFNGLLVAVALAFFFRFDVILLATIVLGSTLAAVVMLVLDHCFHAWNVPPLTAPFVLTVWLLLLTMYHVPLLQPVVPPAVAEIDGARLMPMGLLTSTLRGLGQVLFHDSTVVGVIVLLAIGINSRLSAGFAALGSLAGALAAVALGGDAAWVRHGVYGFNAALCAVVFGGLLFVLTWQTAIFALTGALAGTLLMLWATPYLTSLGLPALSGPLTLTVWLSLLVRPAIRVLRVVPLAEMTTPEEIRQTFLARPRNSTRAAPPAQRLAGTVVVVVDDDVVVDGRPRLAT
jgi:urea transporter